MDRFHASDTFLAERQVVHFRDQRRNSTNRNTSDSSDLDRRTDEAERLLRRIATHHVPAVFASSFGAEDMVLIDMIARNALRIRLFTLDTASLSILGYEHNRLEPAIRLWNDTGHVEGRFAPTFAH